MCSRGLVRDSRLKQRKDEKRSLSMVLGLQASVGENITGGLAEGLMVCMGRKRIQLYLEGLDSARGLRKE